ILAIATFIGIAGCLAATWVAGKFNRKASLIGGYTAMALSIGLLFGVDSVVFFGAAAVLLKIAWPWTLPFLMSTLADLDPLGRVTNLANLAIGGGTAIGPFIAGRVIEATGGYNGLILMGVPVVLVSLLFILVAQSKGQKTRR